MALELSSTDPGTGFIGIALISVMVLLVAVCGLFLWVLRRKRAIRSPETEARDNLLFMKIAYTTEREADGLRQGYLRSLTSERATLVVSDRAVRKGSQLQLDLGSLKSADGSSTAPVKGKVTHTKSLGGSPENVLVNIQFLEHNVPVHEFRHQHSDISAAGPASTL